MAVSFGSVITAGIIGSAVGNGVHEAIKYYQSRPVRPNETQRTLAGIDVTVREEKLNWAGNKIRWTITEAPPLCQEKATVLFVEAHGWTVQASRAECLIELTKKIRQAYKWANTVSEN